ncbi:MAG: hypothetical protein GF329_04005 [Candidatus Lokiarchaeota archaeon]|nr:hypothetical protein [Candidatus Lokiarchaeota archaeon]
MIKRGEKNQNLSNYCFICGEKVIENDNKLKAFETYGGYAKICFDCLNLPIRCLKGKMSLAEIIRRLKILRK